MTRRRATHLTLSQIFERFYIPFRLSDAAPDTIANLRGTLRKWARLTGDPPISTIEAETLIAYRDASAALPGLHAGSKISANTLSTELRQLQGLLNFCGPPGPRARDALGLLKVTPWIRRPRTEEPMPRAVPFDYLSKVYEAAGSMRTPQIAGIVPADWWRALFVVAFNTGLRRRALFALLWSDVDLLKLLLVARPATIKTRRSQTLPFNELTRQHLAKIRNGGGPVFPWPFCKRTFDNEMHALQWAAGIPRTDRFGLHAIRRTNATQLWEDSPQAAQLTLGHTTMGMTARRYVQETAIIRAAVETLRQPEAFQQKGA